MALKSPTSPYKKSAHKKVLTAVLLASTVLGLGGAYMWLQQPDTTNGAPINVSEVQPLDTALMGGPPVYPARAAHQEEYNKNCQVPGTVAVKDQFGDLSELQEYGGAFTRGMLAYAKAKSIYTCYYDAPAYASTFDRDTGVARVNDTGRGAGRMLQDVHATVHGYQQLEGQMQNDGSWNLYSRVMQKLTSEAVAYTGEFAAAVELNNNGDAGLVTFHDKNGTDGWRTFKSVYDRTQDITQASSATVNALLRNPGFVSYHADAAIDDYFADWMNGTVRKDAAIKFTADTAAAMGSMPGGVHLADGVSLPTQETLITVSPDLARAFDVLMPGKERTDYAKYIAAKRSGNGNTYTVRQAMTRVDSDISGKFNYANRGNIGGVQEYCSQADYKYTQVPKATNDLWQNMQTIGRGAVMGPKLIDFSNRANIFYCYFKMDKDTAGEWYDNDGLVRISNAGDSSETAILTTQAHELIHGIQRTNGVSNENSGWRIGDYQLMLLSYEGAARAGQYVLALDLAKNGINEPLDDVLSRFPGPAKAAKNAYDATIAQGKPHADGLKAAGAAGWSAQFADREWADFYNNRVLKSFIGKIVNGTETAPSGATYSLDTARKTGWVSDDFNFTAEIKSLPAFQDRFGGNGQMRQAFDYVANEHLAYRLGRNSQQYLTGLKALEADKNPYLGVDIRVINSTLASPDTTLSPLDAMNCFSGVSTDCTYGGQPLKPNTLKIGMH